MALAADVRKLLDETMTGLVQGDAAVLAKAGNDPKAAKVRAWLDDLLNRVDTYRDGALTLLAFPVAAGQPLDITRRIDGDRATSGHTQRLLDGLNIRCRRDALQTISKGSDFFTGRARASWNELLTWASNEKDVAEVRRAFYYLAKGIAATARSLPAMPPLDTGRLVFPAIARLFDAMLDTPSGGAHEQFIFAALLFALNEEAGRARVETKTLHAADASAGTAADVQVWEGQNVEAYEVTANPWTTKVGQADAVRRHYDLPRVHILAPAPGATGAEVASALAAAGLQGADISVLDVRHTVRTLISQLSRHSRRSALNKLYEYLSQRQPKDDLVARYVQLLGELGLVAT